MKHFEINSYKSNGKLLDRRVTVHYAMALEHETKMLAHPKADRVEIVVVETEITRRTRSITYKADVNV